MKRLIGGACAVLAAGVLLAGVGGCDTKQEKAAKNMISLMDEYADALAGIKTNSDFIDAKPKLEKIGAKIKDAANEAKALPAPTAEERKVLASKYEPEGKRVFERITKEMDRLEKIGVNPMDLMGVMGGAMGGMGGPGLGAGAFGAPPGGMGG